MRTDDLIATLAADARRSAVPAGPSILPATAAGAILTAATFFVLVGSLRSGLTSAIADPRFLMKFAVTLSLAAAAYGVLRDSAFPEGVGGRRLLLLLLPASVMAACVSFELAVLPGDLVAARLVGRNALVCLVDLPLLGTGPLVVLLLALRRGAPARPALSGGVAGLLAGAIGATAYAAYCPDDSPLFVATWYSIGIAGLAVVGAAAGRVLVRW